MKNNIFSKLISFIDKKIVTPVTKIIVKITSKFDRSGRKLENWLTKSNTLLFISLFLAIAIFIMIDQKIIVFNDNTAEVLKEQTVNVIYNSESYVVEGLPETVDVTLIGSKTDLYIAKQSTTHEATIDLSGLGAGTHKVNIKYNQNLGSINYMINPSVATVIIYPKVSETRTLSVDILNQDKIDSKLSIKKLNYETDKIVIKGTEHQLETVAEVKALLDLDNIPNPNVGTFNLKEVPLKAYDKNGEVVNVEIVPGTIDIEVVLDSPSKELAIKVIPTGEVSFGQAISSINLSDTKVIAYGDMASLANLNYIPITIDVTDLKEAKDYKVELTKPVGVKSLSINNVTVSISLGEMSSRDIPDVKIKPVNLDEEHYSVEGTSKNSTQVTVNVKGVKEVIDTITADNITAYIDLSDVKKEGEYEVDVNVEGSDSKVTYTSKSKKVKVNIVKK